MKEMTVRKWLEHNDYYDVVELIEAVMIIWKKKGTFTRRNWWDVLAGGKNGVSRRIEGISFPVLRAAQIRKGVPTTNNAICRNNTEVIPGVRPNKWGTTEIKKVKL